MKTCSVKNCNNKYYSKKYCKKHYQHIYRYGKILDNKIKYEFCKVENCNGKHCSKGYCKRHYEQIKKYGKIKPFKIKYEKCKIKDCNGKHRSKGYCQKHYNQLLVYGEILKRTRIDKNEVVFSEYYCGIWLYNKECKKVAYTIIDKDDYDKIKDYKWTKMNNGYIRNMKNKKFLHQLIKDSKNIDHINGNTLDNRKCNLRKCNISENTRNSKIPKNNTSGYKGVSWNYNKWRATIFINNKNIVIGRFNNKLDAALAYNKAAKKYFGEFSRLNKI